MQQKKPFNKSPGVKGKTGGRPGAAKPKFSKQQLARFKREREKRAKVHAVLAEHFPALFPLEMDSVMKAKPLMVGARKAIMAALDEKQPDHGISNMQLFGFLRLWCKGVYYLQAMGVLDHRHDLEGKPIATMRITNHEKETAEKILKAVQKRQRKAAQEKQMRAEQANRRAGKGKPGGGRPSGGHKRRDDKPPGNQQAAPKPAISYKRGPNTLSLKKPATG